MASPQRPDANLRHDPDDLENTQIENTQMERRRAAGAGFAWWWLFWIIIIGLAIWWAGWGIRGTGGWWWGNWAPTANGLIMKGSGLAAMNAKNKIPYVNEKFHLINVPILGKVSNRLYWIGRNTRSMMLVVLSGNQRSDDPKPIMRGDLVDIVGTVMKTPSAAEIANRWPLTHPGLALLKKEGAYVEASQMQWAPR